MRTKKRQNPTGGQNGGSGLKPSCLPHSVGQTGTFYPGFWFIDFIYDRAYNF